NYKELHRKILQRDGWRCQNCGSRVGLEMHHIRPRSQLGHDARREFDYALLAVPLQCAWTIARSTRTHKCAGTLQRGDTPANQLGNSLHWPFWHACRNPLEQTISPP